MVEWNENREGKVKADSWSILGGWFSAGAGPGERAVQAAAAVPRAPRGTEPGRTSEALITDKAQRVNAAECSFGSMDNRSTPVSHHCRTFPFLDSLVPSSDIARAIISE
jgi:hypothetical protein